MILLWVCCCHLCHGTLKQQAPGYAVSCSFHKPQRVAAWPKCKEGECDTSLHQQDYRIQIMRFCYRWIPSGRSKGNQLGCSMDRLKELDTFSLEKILLRGEMVIISQYLWGCHIEKRAYLFSVFLERRIWKKIGWNWNKGDFDITFGKIFCWPKVSEVWEAECLTCFYLISRQKPKCQNSSCICNWFNIQVESWHLWRLCSRNLCGYRFSH